MSDFNNKLVIDLFEERDKLRAENEALKQRIKRLEEAGDEMMSEPCEYTFEQWIKAREDKP